MTYCLEVMLDEGMIFASDSRTNAGMDNMRSNLSVGMQIDLVCYQRDSLEVRRRRRFDEGDAHFTALGDEWSEGTRQAFRHRPELLW